MDERARKISETMRARKIDNFKAWRERMKDEGKIKSSYEPLERSGELAELIGVVLGDGNITEFPRCECLRITGDAQKPDFVYYAAALVENAFGKKPAIAKVKSTNAMTVTIYEKHISVRLGIPTGSRHTLEYSVPAWIEANDTNVIHFLRGLYEAEGSLNFHPATYTHKLIFSNVNESLLQLVKRLVEGLGFHPHYSYRKIQVS